jgi:hypothetical protein
MLLGVAAFNGAAGWIQPFYESTSLGAVTFTDLAGISRGMGVAIVTGIALAGFAVASWIERTRT